MSNTACANNRRNGDLEINVMPAIRTAMALNSNNVCLICSFFQIMLYVNERIAIVLKYPLKTRGKGKILKMSINKCVSNVSVTNMNKMYINLKILANPKNKNVILK
jgi:hypothetical protein